MKNMLKKLFVGKNLVILLIFSLFLSEIFLSFNETIGFLLYGFLIALCLISLSHIKILNDYGKLIIILMIIPIIRVSGLFINLGLFWETLIFYCLLLFLAFYYSVRFKLDHGHKKEKLDLLPLAVIIGVVLGLIGQGFFNFENYSWIIYLIPLIAYSEEILFRGMIQNLVEKSYGVIPSIFIPAFLYGFFSLGYGYLFALFMFFAGIILGLVYYKTKNIFLTVVINMILHYLLFVLG